MNWLLDDLSLPCRMWEAKFCSGLWRTMKALSQGLAFEAWELLFQVSLIPSPTFSALAFSGGNKLPWLILNKVGSIAHPSPSGTKHCSRCKKHRHGNFLAPFSNSWNPNAMVFVRGFKALGQSHFILVEFLRGKHSFLGFTLFGRC